jgi:hypothetical protein
MANPEKDTLVGLHLAITLETAKFKLPRLGILELKCCVCHPSEPPSTYSPFNVCALVQEQQRLNTGGVIYLDPSYLDISPPTSESQAEDQPKTPEIQLLHTIQVSSILGGDKLVSSGVSSWRITTPKTTRADPRIYYIRCQCSRFYRGEKVDKEKGQILARMDYRDEHIRNDRKNDRPGLAGRKASHRTETAVPLTTSHDNCPFNLSIYKSIHGYYIKGGNPFHEFHAKRDALRVPVNLATSVQKTLICDIHNGAHASSSIALRMHYLRSKRHNTPTLFSKDQIKYLCSKKVGRNIDMTNPSDKSTWDNIFEHIISIEGEYIALMQRVETTTEILTGSEIPNRKAILFNESFQEFSITTKDHPILEQEDAMAERDVSLHRTARNIRDDKEMVVGLAFTTPAEIRQFCLFHTVLHIDATADTNNENRPLAGNRFLQGFHWKDVYGSPLFHAK